MCPVRLPGEDCSRLFLEGRLPRGGTPSFLCVGLQTREPAASACTLLAETIIVIIIVISLLDFLLFCRQVAESGREEGRAWWHTLRSSAHPGGPRYAPSASPLFRFTLQSQHFFKRSSLVPLGLQLPGLFSGSRDLPAGLGSACRSLVNHQVPWGAGILRLRLPHLETQRGPCQQVAVGGFHGGP